MPDCISSPYPRKTARVDPVGGKLRLGSLLITTLISGTAVSIGCQRNQDPPPSTPAPDPALEKPQDIKQKPLDLSLAQSRSWRLLEEQRAARRYQGNLWLSSSLLDSSVLWPSVETQAKVQAWIQANRIESGTLDLRFERDEAPGGEPCLRPDLRMWLPYSGLAVGGSERCEHFFTGLTRSEPTSFLVLKTSLLTLSNAPDRSEIVGFPLAGDRFAFFMAPLADGGLDFEALKESAKLGFVEHANKRIAFPEIQMQLVASGTEMPAACPSKTLFRLGHFGLDLGTRDVVRKWSNQEIYSPGRKELENTWIVDRPFEFALLDKKSGLLVASGTYFDSNGTSLCLKVGAFAKLDVDASGKRTRIGRAYLGRRLGDYLQ